MNRAAWPARRRRRDFDAKVLLEVVGGPAVPGAGDTEHTELQSELGADPLVGKHARLYSMMLQRLGDEGHVLEDPAVRDTLRSLVLECDEASLNQLLVDVADLVARGCVRLPMDTARPPGIGNTLLPMASARPPGAAEEDEDDDANTLLPMASARPPGAEEEDEGDDDDDAEARAATKGFDKEKTYELPDGDKPWQTARRKGKGKKGKKEKGKYRK